MGGIGADSECTVNEGPIPGYTVLPRKRLGVRVVLGGNAERGSGAKAIGTLPRTSRNLYALRKEALLPRYGPRRTCRMVNGDVVIGIPLFLKLHVRRGDRGSSLGSVINGGASSIGRGIGRQSRLVGRRKRVVRYAGNRGRGSSRGLVALGGRSNYCGTGRSGRLLRGSRSIRIRRSRGSSRDGRIRGEDVIGERRMRGKHGRKHSHRQRHGKYGDKAAEKTLIGGGCVHAHLQTQSLQVGKTRQHINRMQPTGAFGV